MNNGLLNFDLNEIASTEIKAKISSLENTVGRLVKENEQLLIDRKNLKKKSVLNENFSFLTGNIVAQWLGCKTTLNKCQYIEAIMLCIFNIKKTYRFYDSAGLIRNLAINYYDHKEELIHIALLLDLERFTEDITKFKMPCDWSKDQIMNYVKLPHYCTNGEIYGAGRYYFEHDSNTPHDLVQGNTYIIEPDVFDEIIKTIEDKVPNSIYLYTIPKYNKAMPKEQIQRLGRTLINHQGEFYDIIKSFIADNMESFDDETLEYFYSKISHDNQFKTFHWQNFPVRYQQRYLQEKQLKEILSVITNSNCKWTDQQKEDFLRDYLKDDHE